MIQLTLTLGEWRREEGGGAIWRMGVGKERMGR